MTTCQACGQRKPTGTVRVLCPSCMGSMPLTGGKGPVGAKVWTCPHCGHTFGPGTRTDERREGSRVR